jgi:hypothetical protein
MPTPSREVPNAFLNIEDPSFYPNEAKPLELPKL